MRLQVIQISFAYSLFDIQQDLDEWIRAYNEERPYSGKDCYGKTPMQTFLDAKGIALKNQVREAIH